MSKNIRKVINTPRNLLKKKLEKVVAALNFYTYNSYYIL
jgi:hypothetical protein